MEEPTVAKTTVLGDRLFPAATATSPKLHLVMLEVHRGHFEWMYLCMLLCLQYVAFWCGAQLSFCVSSLLTAQVYKLIFSSPEFRVGSALSYCTATGNDLTVHSKRVVVMALLRLCRRLVGFGYVAV
jgi:hypothetical protein